MAAGAGTISEVARNADIAKAHARLVADGSTQFDLPGLAKPEIPAWIEPLIAFLRTISPAFPYIFWGAVAIGVALILWAIAGEARGTAFEWPWRRKKAAVEEPEWQPDAAAARALLSEAEALAREGRFAEAARLLLHRSIEDIAERRPEFLKPSLTARDIAAADTLPGGARDAFGAIARVVEVSTFGSASLTADAWEDCRTAYGNFALAGAWRG